MTPAASGTATPTRRRSGAGSAAPSSRAARRVVHRDLHRTLGPSGRAVVPVRGRAVVAWSRSGITVDPGEPRAGGSADLLTAVAALLLAGLGSWLTSRWLRRQTHDWGRPNWPGCTSTTTRCCTRCARACCCSTGPAGCSWSTTRPGGCSGSPIGRSGSRSTRGLPDALGGALLEGAERVDEITWPARGSSWSTRPRPDGPAATGYRGHAARPHRAAALIGELKTSAASPSRWRAGPRVGQPAAHGGVAGRTRAPGAGAGLRHRGAGRRPAADRPRRRRDRGAGGGRVGAGQGGRGRRARGRAAGRRRHRALAGRADPRDLVTIVGNLVDNAIDAAAEGGRRGGSGSAPGGPSGGRAAAAGRGQRPGAGRRGGARVFKRG